VNVSAVHDRALAVAVHLILPWQFGFGFSAKVRLWRETAMTFVSSAGDVDLELPTAVIGALSGTVARTMAKARSATSNEAPETRRNGPPPHERREVRGGLQNQTLAQRSTK
jgi:hypothetical protein